jgi:hypothetical protein
MPETKAARERAAAVRTTRGLEQVWEDRKSLVKREMEAESAANDAKTARLRALRLEKEQQEAEAKRLKGEEAPAAAPKKRAMRRIVVE